VSSRRVPRVGAIAFTVVGLFTLVGVLSSWSANEPAREALACKQKSMIIPEGSGETRATPDQAVIATAWLTAIGIPAEAQYLDESSSSPSDGVVDVTEETLSDESSTYSTPHGLVPAGVYQVNVDSRAVAEVVVERDEATGLFDVGAISSLLSLERSTYG
jgi:hypothetical protein